MGIIMANLATTYMGIPLANPVMVAASAISNKVDNIKRVEAAGAGGLVIRSLFEEQIRHEVEDLEDSISAGGDSFSESLSYFPKIEINEAREHLYWVEKARKHVEMPLFASLNAVSPGKWADYAKQLAETGVDGLELNYYKVESSLTATAADSEKRLLETFESVRAAVDIPLAVKLSPYYTTVGSIVKGLEERGAQGVVLFNRFFQPDIDPETERLVSKMVWSNSAEMRLPLRWVALLYGKVMCDLAGNTGVTAPADVVKYLLAGASVVQVASCLFTNGVEYVGDLVKGVDDWMERKGYASVEDFRGKVSQQGFEGDSDMFERAQYVDLLRGKNR